MSPSYTSNPGRPQFNEVPTSSGMMMNEVMRHGPQKNDILENVAEGENDFFSGRTYVSLDWGDEPVESEDPSDEELS